MIDFGNRRQLMTLLRNPSKMEDLMMESPDGDSPSPAAIFADIFTVMRADTARLAEEHGVNMEVEVMGEDVAAELLASVVTGEGAALVAAFNREAERRDRVLRAVLDDEEYQQFLDEKVGALRTEADGEFADEDLHADTEPVDVEQRLRDDATEE